MVGTPELSVVFMHSRVVGRTLGYRSSSALRSCRSYFGLSVVFSTSELSVVFWVVVQSSGLSVVLWVIGRPLICQLSSEMSIVFWVIGCPLRCWLSSGLSVVL